MMTSFFVADVDEVEIARRALAVRRVGDELAVDAADAHGADRAGERDVGDQSAALAPLMERMSGSFSPSALSRMPMIWVS